MQQPQQQLKRPQIRRQDTTMINKTKQHARLFCSMLLALLAGTALAHHSTRGIYEEEAIEVTGTVIDWRFINPHPYLTISVEGEDGVTREWDVSYGGAAVVHMQRQGYTETTFKPGDVIIVKGLPAKAEGVYGILIEGAHPTWPDGKQVVQGGSMF
jgi:hypothetical protein